METRRVLVGALVVGAAGLLVAVGVLWLDDDEVSTSTTASDGTSSTSDTTAPTATTSSSPPQPPSGEAPAAVMSLEAGPGGGSGEVSVRWTAVPGATRYVVERSAAAGGPFIPTAEIDVTSGVATARAEVVNVWSAAHSYIPTAGPLTGSDASSEFEYVDLGPAERCFRVIAAADGVEAAPSEVVCAAPI